MIVKDFQSFVEVLGLLNHFRPADLEAIVYKIQIVKLKAG